MILNIRYSLEPYINFEKKKLNKNTYKDFTEEGLNNSGAHNFYSSILKNLTGGIKAHVNNEDPDWTGRASLAFMKDKKNSFYDKDYLFNAMSFNLGNPVMDEGAIERALEKNTPVLNVWYSHDLISGGGQKPLEPVDMR